MIVLPRKYKAISKNMIIITSGNGKKQWLKAAKFGCQSWLARSQM